MSETLEKPLVISYASPTPPAAPAKPSDWSPLRNPIFRAMWIASAVSYTGYEIRNYAAPLLMVDFKKIFGVSDGMAAYTFTASTLPIPILVLFAGALADVLDRRKLLIVTHLGMMIAAGGLGILTICHLMTPWLMLGFLFIIGAGYAMMNPTLLAVIPELVEPGELRSAMALNSVNMNIARVAGPAIGGLIVVLVGVKNFYLGKGVAFLATAISLSGVVWVLARWKPPERKKPAHPEAVWDAVRTGFRYTRFSPRLLAILARVFLFIFCAGILPTFSGIICKKNPGLLHGDTGASILMASLGLGAIIGVYYMQAMQRRFGVEESVTVCTILYGSAMLGVAWMPSLYLGCVAMFVAGFNWVIVPTNFNIATQLAVPAWIKGRAMGMYVLVLWGSMSAGSFFFGTLTTAFADKRLAPDHAPRLALGIAGVGVLLGSLSILWLRLVPPRKEDFAPAKRGPLPMPPELAPSPDSPVTVAVKYAIAPVHHEKFHELMRDLRHQRLRNGASHWEMTDGAGTFMETFVVSSWPARVRFHERMTAADAELEKEIVALHTGTEPPLMTHRAIGPKNRQSGSAWWATAAESCLDAVDREFLRGFERMRRLRDRDLARNQTNVKRDDHSGDLHAK